MNMPYNTFEIEHARHQYMMEGENRERLVKIALAGRKKYNPIVKMMQSFQRIVQPRASFQPQNPPVVVSEVNQPATSG